MHKSRNTFHHNPGATYFQGLSLHSFLILTQVTCLKLSHLNSLFYQKRRQNKGMKGINKEGKG